MKNLANMTTIEQIEGAILTLPRDDFNKLRKWFLDMEDRRWDEQLEQDVAQGKLDVLGKEAISEFTRGIKIGI